MTQSGQQGGLDRVYMVQSNRANGRAGVLNFGVRDIERRLAASQSPVYSFNRQCPTARIQWGPLLVE
jgi:hypothetical protein